LSINNLLYTRRPTNYEIFDGQSLLDFEEKMRTRERREDENKSEKRKRRTEKDDQSLE
jgi:hypothetical protein